MLSFIKISALYENYLLVKLVAYLRERGYILEKVKRCIYVLVNKNWTQILNFFYSKDCFLCNAIDFLIHPCLAGWSISGIPRL